MTDKNFQKYGNNPLPLFRDWYADAEKNEPHDPNAMALATVNKNGRPEVRIVLLKAFGDQGFTFFTNLESAKAQSLLANPYAELNFYWKSLGRQIRIAGPVVKAGDAEADEYFATRSRGNRLGAWASQQSRPVKSYEEFEQRVAQAEQKFSDQEIPRPPHWGGFRLMPERMEFWIGHPHRLHKRFLFTKKDNGDWDGTWLFP